MRANKAWYAAKRDEMYRAYQAAIEREEMEEAERLFKEYESYAKMAKQKYIDNTQHFGENI